jgi:uncharacterized protein (DUF488 family)
MGAQTTVWTIGHWTCPEETFLGLLRGEQIELVADVRAHPGSRTSPQFGRDTMPAWLDGAGIGYAHIPALGGRRPKQDVEPGINSGWRQPSFKNYADYTLGPDYERGIEQLIQLASERRLAYLCAEPMPWRCHRLLISNTLAARGLTVRHIVAGQHAQVHQLGKWGATPRVHPDGTITYPPDD